MKYHVDDHLHHCCDQSGLAVLVIFKDHSMERFVAMSLDLKLDGPDPCGQHARTCAVGVILAFAGALMSVGS